MHDRYVSSPAIPWTGTDALFCYWFGINDVPAAISLDGHYTQDSQRAILASYLAMLETAHAAGARHFLIHTVPPMGLSPGLRLALGPDGAAAADDAIISFNAALLRMLAAFRAAHGGVTALVHDTHALFHAVRADPGRFPQTSRLRVLDAFCDAYAFPKTVGMPFAHDDSCLAPVSQYLWNDLLHVTWPFHELLAAEVAKLLG